MENKTAELQALKEKHSSAKKKMILGIVFIACAAVVEFTGIIFFAINEIVALLLTALSGPFWGLGIAFLIIGIVGMSKANRRISTINEEIRRASQPQKQPEPAPVTEPEPIVEPAPEKEPEPVAQPEPETEPAPADEPTPEAEPPKTECANAENKKFIDIDLEKYAPLDAGVSYNPDKNYDFHRAEGFVGSLPQTFVNRTFLKCPLCCTSDPYWKIAQHNQMSWKGNLYLFKCSHCEGIISMSMPDVTTLGNGGGGVAASPTVGLTNLMVKASSGKEAGAVYAVIETVGNSGVNPECNGKEFKLEQLQEMLLRM